MTNKCKIPRLIPVAKWNEYHMWPTMGGLRWLIHKAEKKDFQDVYLKAGGVLLINEDKFFEWVERTSKKEKTNEDTM